MQGGVSDYIVQSVKFAQDPWKRFEEFLTELDPDTERPRMSYLRQSSVIMRLIDGQREVINIAYLYLGSSPDSF